MTPRSAIPVEWLQALVPARPVALGLDIATTEKGTSNPSVLSVMQHASQRAFHVPLLVSWKTADPAITEQMINVALLDLVSASFRPRRLCIDASSEVFFATNLRRRFAGAVTVDLVKGGEKRKYKGEELDAKTLLGNLYCNALDDGLIILPPGDWIKEDHRLVAREKGGFATATGTGGQHGDTFDGCKLAYWGLIGGGGPVGAAGAGVGELAGAKPRPSNFKGPIGGRQKRMEVNYA
jgi:hypothetical protein